MGFLCCGTKQAAQDPTSKDPTSPPGGEEETAKAGKDEPQAANGTSPPRAVQILDEVEEKKPKAARFLEEENTEGGAITESTEDSSTRKMRKTAMPQGALLGAKFSDEEESEEELVRETSGKARFADDDEDDGAERLRGDHKKYFLNRGLYVIICPDEIEGGSFGREGGMSCCVMLGGRGGHDNCRRRGNSSRPRGRIGIMLAGYVGGVHVLAAVSPV